MADNFFYLEMDNSVYEAPLLREIGGRYLRKTKQWQFPRLKMVVRDLQMLYPSLSEDFEQLLSDKFSCIVINPNLFRFQRELVSRLLLSTLPGQLIAASPGSGKTVIVSTALNYMDAEKVLIICPLILRTVWQEHLEKWGNREASICWGRPPQGDWVITNYETLTSSKWGPAYRHQKWDVLIVDESTRVKNKATKSFEMVLKIREMSRKVWLLSGTPVTRFVDDLWAQFRIIWPSAFTSYWRFANKFCVIEENVWGRQVVGNRIFNYQDLLSDIMTVTRLRDVVELPDFFVHQVEVVLNPDQLEAHRSALEEFKVQLDEGVLDIPGKLAQLTRLQQIASNLGNLNPSADSSGKSDTIMEIIDSLTAEDFPILIWAHWRRSAELLYSRLLRDAPNLSVGLMIGGSADILDQYKDGQYNILIMSLDVGKFGLTLTETKTVIYHDLSLKAEDFIQSLYRVQRIGLQHRPHLYILKSPGTIDEFVETNLDGKARAIQQITGEDIQTLLSRN